jgi:hypothetical protein
MSIEKPITIAKAIENILNNDYVLPAIQREFVWGTDQIEKLFDSLMRGYPVGSFLFWEIKPERFKDFQLYRFMDRYHEKDYKHNEPIELIGERSRIAVLDGQQRLTALNIGLKGWYAEKLPYYRWNSEYAYPKRRLYVNILSRPSDESDFAYGFKMMKEDEAKEKDESHWWYPVGDVLQYKDIKDVFKFCQENDLLRKELDYPSETLVGLWEVICKKETISYFLEEEQNLDKVLNIFIRVNSGGTILSYSDMLLSIATAHWKKYDAREVIYGLVDDLNMTGESFNYSKDFILKSCLVMTDRKAIEFKANSFSPDNMKVIEEQWEKISEALRLTTKLLSSWGYSRDTLVSNNAVIPLAYFIFKKGNPGGILEANNPNNQLMRRWLMKALLKQTFGGQSDNILRRVREVMSKSSGSFPEREIYAALASTPKSMAFDENMIDGLLDHRYLGHSTFTILSMLYPWLKFDQHFHIDHIFPRSMFTPKIMKKHGIPEEKWTLWLDHKDDLANLQLLQGKVNQNKSDKEFEKWLLDNEKEPAGLASYKEQNFIPKVSLSFANFPEFLEARAQIIKNKLKDLLL